MRTYWELLDKFKISYHAYFRLATNIRDERALRRRFAGAFFPFRVKDFKVTYQRWMAHDDAEVPYSIEFKVDCVSILYSISMINPKKHMYPDASDITLAITETDLRRIS